MTPEAYLDSITREKMEIDRFLSLDYFDDPIENNKGWVYSSEFGWVLKDAWRHDGVDGCKTFYSYAPSGERKVVNFPDQPCRIHTYGNSFTHCDQVSDGETWQEFLAAHIQEPIKNYGVGGYSVYQAYLRMLHIEAHDPADYIILNIWSDDHFRNLDSWRSIRFGCFSSCGLTLPHLRVNVEKGECIERPNLCPTPDSLYGLCDRDFIYEHFLDDPVLKSTLICKHDAIDIDAHTLTVSFGLAQAGGNNLLEQTQIAHAQAALFATENIVSWCDEFCNRHNKKLLLILSHDRDTVAKDLRREPRWDQTFLDFLAQRQLPVVDLRDAHRAEFDQMKMDVEAYLDRYYNFHYSPAGNFFFANELRSHMSSYLDPKPKPYC